MDKDPHNPAAHGHNTRSFSPGYAWGVDPAYANRAAPFNKRIYRTFVFFRYASLFLTSFIFLIGRFPMETAYKLLLCGLLFILATVSVQIYRRYQENIRVVKNLTLAEAFGITLLAIFTGGLASPFVLYFMNPLVMASLHLPLIYTWAFLGLFLSWTLLIEGFFQETLLSFSALLSSHIDILLVLILLTLVVQIFARIYYTLSEQSQQLEIQQEELLASFLDLTENHQIIEALSEFQRESVSYKREEDILSRLATVSSFVFPFKKSGVLYLDYPLDPDSTRPFESYTLITGHKEETLQEQNMVHELRERREELFSRQTPFTGRDRSWLAMPIRLEKGQIIAIFIARMRETANPGKYPETLGLFINFTEQVIESLRSFKQTEETIYHLSSLYEAVETISSREDPREIMDLFSTYAWKLTKSEKVIFWIDQLETEQGGRSQASVYSVKGQSELFPEESWQGTLLEAWAAIKDNPAPSFHSLGDEEGNLLGEMICVPVKSHSRCLGILAALQSRQRSFHREETLQKLSFLADLSAISIERMVTEVFTDKMLVLDEQKRIANEIHDSISQNLFSIVYGLQSVTRQVGELKPELQEQLSAIQEVAGRTSKELRLLIYRLSPRKRGDDTFVAELRSYLNGLSHINNTPIDFRVEGTEEYLNPSMRGAFYRIIKEATGNSIRHGGPRKLEVTLKMSPFAAALTIVDDGQGFDAQAFQENEHLEGLGLINMRELAHSLQGTFKLRSAPGEGTSISVRVPTSPVSKGRALVSR